MAKVPVALVKTQNPYEGVPALAALLSSPVTIRGAAVLVKPNLCGPFPPEDIPSSTHPEVVAAVVRWLYAEGAREVLVGDEPVWGLRSRFAHERSGVQAVVEREGGRLIHLDEEPRVEKPVPGGRVFDTLALPKVLDEVDILVNVPKLKVNMMCQVSLAIKNLFGLLSFRDRKKFHRGFDLAFVLLDIAKVVQPPINIIDAMCAMEGMSAHAGTAVPLGLLIGSPVALAADVVGSRIMGFDPMEIGTTQLALRERLGLQSVDQIELVGEPPDGFQRHFQRPYVRLVHPASNVELFPGGICPGCTGRLPKIPPRIESGKRYAVVMGRRISPRGIDEFDEVWCFGDCGIDEGRGLLRRFPGLKGKLRRVPGCPPLEWWAEHTLKEELQDRGWWTEGAITR